MTNLASFWQHGKPQQKTIGCLSVQQPYAWLLAHAGSYSKGKDIENRNWDTSYRGQILIHAGKQLDADIINTLTGQWIRQSLPDHWKEAWETMPVSSQDFFTGGIVGVATLVDVVTQSSSPWFKGPYGFVLKDARPLPFTPYRGRLGIFQVPLAALRVITRQGPGRLLDSTPLPVQIARDGIGVILDAYSGPMQYFKVDEVEGLPLKEATLDESRTT